LNRLYSILLLLITTICTRAQNQNIEFIENKGQWDSQVKYMGNVPAGAFFIRSTGFTVLQHNASDLNAVYEEIKGHSHAENAAGAENLILHSHAYNVDFVGASRNFQIIPDKPLNTYNNYFIGNDPSKWAGNCRIYQAVTMKDVYPGVDIRYYTNEGSMKYDIIVNPGADISKIKMKYKGADQLRVSNKQLVVSTSVGEVKELEPYSYQFENSVKKDVNTRYIVKGDELSFDVRNYNKNEVLIIDPTWIFSSFSGSTIDNWGFTATYGPDGSMYGGGIVFGTGFPTTAGAFQTAFGGGEYDIGIIKLTPTGNARVYATYIGGSDKEQPHSLVVDPSGNLIIAGRSNSPNYPTVPSGAGGTIGSGGGFDIVVTKLNAAGSALVGSKKIGGSADDGVNISVNRTRSLLQQNYGDDGRSEVILDAAGNIYVASCSRSSNFPVTPGAFQTTFGGGNQDGVVLKLDPNITNLSFGSYLGGSAEDAAYVLSLSPAGEIFVGGGTMSNDFPGNKTGTINPTFQGNVDGFLAVVSNNGATLVRSTYLGTSNIDQVYGVQFDKNGFPYVMGQTLGSWPVINAVYSNAGAPQFIAKLQPDLSAFVYSTRFGKSATIYNISPVAFLVDNCENVYVSGWGGTISGMTFASSGTTGLPVTPDAIKATTDGQDFYFFVLQKNASAQLFGSFFGQNGGLVDHVDGGTSRFDSRGIIYQAICANCGGGATFPTGPGTVWAPTNGTLSTTNPRCNLAMVKIELDFTGVQTGISSTINGVPRDTSGCVPLTVDFTDTVAKAKKYIWDFGDGSGVVTTTTPNTNHTYNAIGTFLVKLIAEDSNTCNIRDSSFIRIRVGNLEALLDFNPVKLTPCDSLKFRFDNLSTAPAVQPFSGQAFRWDFGDGSPQVVAGTGPVTHSYSAPGSYTVKLILLDTVYCNYPDSLTKTINIAPNVIAQFTTPPVGCVPYTASFTNTSIAGQTFVWDFGDGSTSTAINPVHTYVTPGTYTVRLTATDPNTCNITDDTTANITVVDNPVADFTVSPVPAVENSPAIFTNLSSADAVSFKWLFGDGDSLLTTSRAPVSHQYVATGTYNVCLIAFNSNGCSDTICKPADALILALVDLPNAFTPNSGDINSKVMVRGFGIVKMRFIIWNRWGQKVFESSSITEGWDGKYKGVLQPMDVYAYTLEAEFFDGTKTTKKGDITLIR